MSTTKPAAEKSESRFTHILPTGREFFSLREVAEMWSCHGTHVMRLIECGALAAAVDLRLPGTSKAMVRIPRATLIEFLEKRAA